MWIGYKWWLYFTAAELETKRLTQLLFEKDKQLRSLEEKLKSEQDEKVDLIQEQEEYRKKIESEKLSWSNENQKLIKENENLKQLVTTNQTGAENLLKTRIEQEKMILITEQDQERSAYQQLLREYSLLEQHCENLEAKITLNSRGNLSATSTMDSKHMRSLSDVSNVSELNDEIYVGSINDDVSPKLFQLCSEKISWGFRYIFLGLRLWVCSNWFYNHCKESIR